MVLAREDGKGYFYIHRMLYDQAVVIHDIYKDEIPMLIKALTNKEESRADVDYFLENTPAPISSLAPFLLLVKSGLEEFKDMVGAIHVMSGPVNLRGLLKYPYELRNTPSFSLSIREEYELSWDRFFQTAMPFGSQQFVQPQVTTAVQTNISNTYAPTTEVKGEAVVLDGVKYTQTEEAPPMTDNDDIEAWMAKMEAEALAQLDKDKDKDKDKKETPPTPAPTPAPEPAHTPTKPIAGDSTKAGNGVDLLKEGLL